MEKDLLRRLQETAALPIDRKEELYGINQQFRTLYLEMQQYLIAEISEYLSHVSARSILEVTGLVPSHFSRMIHGQRPIPARFADRYCHEVRHISIYEWITGQTNKIVLPTILGYIASALENCTTNELLFISNTIRGESTGSQPAPNGKLLTELRVQELCQNRWLDCRKLFAYPALSVDGTSHVPRGQAATIDFDVGSYRRGGKGNSVGWKNWYWLFEPEGREEKGRYDLDFGQVLFLAFRFGVPIDYIATRNYIEYSDCYYSLDRGGVWRSVPQNNHEYQRVTNPTVLQILSQLLYLAPDAQASAIAKIIQLIYHTTEGRG